MKHIKLVTNIINLKKYIMAKNSVILMSIIIKFLINRHKYQIEDVFKCNDIILIKYFAIGTRLVWVRPINEIIRNRVLLNNFSAQDASLLGDLFKG